MRKFYVAKGFENDNVELPLRSTSHAAGYDFKSIVDETIPPHTIKLIATGVKASMGEDEVLMLYPRSSLGKKKGLMLSNSVGVIDADYFENPDNDGHIMISLYNFSSTDATISKGERIAQGVFIKYYTTDDDQVNATRQGGFGSTGR